MTAEKLKRSYQKQLIKAGVEPQRATQAATTMTLEELRLIGEIWQEWAQTSHFHHAVQSLREDS